MQAPAPQLFAPKRGAAQIFISAMMLPLQWMRRGAGANYPHGLSVNDRFQHTISAAAFLILVGVTAACHSSAVQVSLVQRFHR
jgi:hypothetical protein